MTEMMIMGVAPLSSTVPMDCSMMLAAVLFNRSILLPDIAVLVASADSE